MPRLMMVAAALVSTGLSSETSRELRFSMGTLVEIRLSGAPEGAGPAAIGGAFARIDEVERALSIWADESEISELNLRREAVLSEVAYRAVEKAVAIARDSGGAFDPTLSPSGYESVVLDGEERRVSLERGVTLDLGALAKGLAVDRALETLSPVATSALVDIGTSSIGLYGDEAVTFEVRDPSGGEPPASFELRRGAVGSSSLDQWGEHITDPRTGRPVGLPHPSAVTVVSQSAIEADALSTAIFVLGAKGGLELAARRGADALVLVEDERGRTLWSTPGFAERYALDVAEGVAIRVSPER